MASQLEILQRQFTASAIGEADPKFVESVKGGGKLSAADAVAVYRGGYPARMSEALGETFEACWRVLGDEEFLEACKIYSRSVPSKSHNLSDYGFSFPNFLLNRFRAQAPFIGDLGALEWAYKELFHAAPHTALTAEQLSVAVKENSVLIFGSAVQSLSFDFSVVDIWRRDRSDATPLSRSDWDGPQCALLYKSGGTQVFSRILAAPEASVINSLFNGISLDNTLASSTLDESAARHFFSFISAAGLIVEVRQP